MGASAEGGVSKQRGADMETRGSVRDNKQTTQRGRASVHNCIYLCEMMNRRLSTVSTGNEGMQLSKAHLGGGARA